MQDLGQDFGQDRVQATVPRVSVIMAVHNGMPYVESALRSVMDQTLREIEIIVIDDASHDETPAVLARLAAGDPRLRIITLATNLRLPRALNEGLAVARAPYAARMDADDIAMPNRLAVQIRYMDEHPDVVLIGASFRRVNSAGTVLHVHIRDYDDVLTRWCARFRMPLVHPTFMFRRFAADGGFPRYNVEAGVAEDYDFVAQALERGRVVSLPDVLLDWRVHEKSMTSTQLQAQRRDAEASARRVQAIDLPQDLRNELEGLMQMLFHASPATMRTLRQCLRALRKVIAFDARQSPQRASAIKQMAVTIVVFGYGTKGMSRPKLLLLLLVLAPDFFVAGLRGYAAARRPRTAS